MNKFFKRDKGFTMVELVVVIVILAILIGVSVAGYSKYIGQSKTNTDIQNAETIRAAMINAQAETGAYEAIVAGTGKSLTITVTNDGIAFSGDMANANAFTDAIVAQLQLGTMPSSANAKIKTQFTGGSFTVVGTCMADGSVTVVVTGSGSYPAGTILAGS